MAVDIPISDVTFVVVALATSLIAAVFLKYACCVCSCFNFEGDCAYVIKGNHEVRSTQFDVCLKMPQEKENFDLKSLFGLYKKKRQEILESQETSEEKTVWGKMKSILSTGKNFIGDLVKRDENEVDFPRPITAECNGSKNVISHEIVREEPIIETHVSDQIIFGEDQKPCMDEFKTDKSHMYEFKTDQESADYSSTTTTNYSKIDQSCSPSPPERDMEAVLDPCWKFKLEGKDVTFLKEHSLEEKADLPMKNSMRPSCLKEIVITSFLTITITAALIFGSVALYNHLSA